MEQGALAEFATACHDCADARVKREANEGSGEPLRWGAFAGQANEIGGGKPKKNKLAEVTERKWIELPRDMHR